jgi:hypothetical protein
MKGRTCHCLQPNRCCVPPVARRVGPPQLMAVQGEGVVSMELRGYEFRMVSVASDKQVKIKPMLQAMCRGTSSPV